MDDYFDILGLAKNADAGDVTRAYLCLTRLYSPDNLATYAMLSDEDRTDRLARFTTAYRQLTCLLNAPGSASAAANGSAVAERPDPASATGAYLRWLRERAGMSIRQIAEHTKISPFVLEALEAERFQRLPSAVYVRGYIREIARCLDLCDPAGLADLYQQRIDASPGGT